MRMMDATVIADYNIEWSHAAELKGYCESERECVCADGHARGGSDRRGGC